jgi:hypothetical protein
MGFYWGPNIMYNYYRFWEFGIWNMDNLITCGIPYANIYGIPRYSAEFREKCTVKIPRNFAEFRGIPYDVPKISYSAGSKKSTSVDTLVPSGGGGAHSLAGEGAANSDEGTDMPSGTLGRVKSLYAVHVQMQLLRRRFFARNLQATRQYYNTFSLIRLHSLYSAKAIPRKLKFTQIESIAFIAVGDPRGVISSTENHN